MGESLLRPPSRVRASRMGSYASLGGGEMKLIVILKKENDFDSHSQLEMIMRIIINKFVSKNRAKKYLT